MDVSQPKKKSIHHVAFRAVIASAFLSALALIIIIVFWGTHAFSSHLKQSSEERSQSMFNGMEALMKKGANSEELHRFAEQINTLYPEMNVSFETQNFERLTEVTIEQGDGYIQVKHPVVYKQSCLACHQAGQLGEQRGLITHQYPVDKIVFSFADVIGLLVLFAGITFLLTFTLTFWYLRKMVILPLFDLNRFINNVSGHEDLDVLEHPSHVKEIENIRSAFNRLAKDLRHSYGQALSKAETDSLTGLRNRHSYDEVFDFELIKAQKTQQGFALIMMDLNFFKIINDELGHQTGDLALQKFAEILQKSVRSNDFIFRLGGDEFVVLLNQTTQESLQIVLKKIEQNLANDPLELEDRKIVLSASLGAAVFPEDGESKEQLTHIADERMYEHKAQFHRQAKPEEKR